MKPVSALAPLDYHCAGTGDHKSLRMLRRIGEQIRIGVHVEINDADFWKLCIFTYGKLRRQSVPVLSWLTVIQK